MSSRHHQVVDYLFFFGKKWLIILLKEAKVDFESLTHSQCDHCSAWAAKNDSRYRTKFDEATLNNTEFCWRWCYHTDGQVV